MSSCALGSSAALWHVQGVDAVVSVLARRVHGQTPHVVEGRVKWQTCAHPEVHICAQVVARCPKVVLIVACKTDKVTIESNTCLT